MIRSDSRTFTLLMLHGVVVFLNDVVTIYATMWFSQPADYKFSKHGEALIAGIEYGSLALIGYTVIDSLKINNRVLHFVSYF